MPPDKRSATTTSGREPETTKEREYRRAHVSRDEARSMVWLPWWSNGCEHGIKSHKVAEDGSIIEVPEIKTRPHKKPRAVSTRQRGRI